MLNKKIILPVIGIFTIVAGIALASTSANAQTKNNPFSGLVQTIAQKFNLDQSQVQSVFDDFKNQKQQNMQQNRQQREEDRLNKLVQDKKITDSQKQAILDELAKIKKEYPPESLKNLTADQRKQQFQKEQEEIKSWAQANGIDQSYLMPGFGIGGFRGGMRKGNGKFYRTAPTPTPAS